MCYNPLSMSPSLCILYVTLQKCQNDTNCRKQYKDGDFSAGLTCPWFAPASGFLPLPFRLKFLTQVPAVLSASLRRRCCRCCCWDDRRLCPSASATHINRRTTQTRLRPVSCRAARRGRTGRVRRTGRKSSDAALSVACRIYFSRRDDVDAMECAVQTATDRRGASLPRGQLISPTSSGHYDRLLIVEIERHFHLVFRSVSALTASPAFRCHTSIRRHPAAWL